MGYVRDSIRRRREARWSAAFDKALASVPHTTEAAPVPSLMDFVPATTPEYESPLHLAPVVEAFEPIARGEAVELAFSVPPRHFKTTTLLHGVSWLMLQRPRFRVAFLTFNQKRAEEVSREAQRIAKRAGLRPGEGGARDSMREWETANGCRFVATSISGGVIGSGFDLIVIDDPYRRRQDAESALIRRRVMESWAADVYTRQEATGTSFIVLHTRWHPDDLIGNITDPDYRDGRPFHYVNLPALSEDGKALAPRFYDVARLAELRAGVTEYEWASQFQGEPIAKGGRVFDAATMTDEVPARGQYAIGVDLAYSEKTLADYSVAVVLCRHGNPKDPRWTIVDMVRRQCQAPDFALVLKGLRAQYPGAALRFYAAGVEKGGADWLTKAGVPLQVMQTSKQKFQRAQPVAAMWNAGKVWVPRAAWTDSLVDEVTNFTGINDDHDDIVDALAAAYDLLATSSANTGAARPTAARRARKGWRSAY